MLCSVNTTDMTHCSMGSFIFLGRKYCKGIPLRAIILTHELHDCFSYEVTRLVSTSRDLVPSVSHPLETIQYTNGMFDRFSIGDAMLSLEEYECEVWKTAQLQQILIELEAERAALLRRIGYCGAVWRARGVGDHVFQHEKAQANLLKRKMWSARLMVEQRQREVHAVRPQQHQPRKKERDAAVWWERENRNSARRWALIAEQARQADEEREVREEQRETTNTRRTKNGRGRGERGDIAPAATARS